MAEKRGKEEGCIFRDNGEMDRRGKGRGKKENNRYYYFSRNMSVQSINRNPYTYDLASVSTMKTKARGRTPERTVPRVT